MNRGLPSEPLTTGMTRLRYLPLVLVFIAGTGLSLTVFAVLRRAEWRQIQTDFKVVVRGRAAAVEAAAEENSHVLDAVRNLYAAVPEVDRAGFQRFVRPLIDRARGTQALGWVPRVRAAGRSACETAARREGWAGFQFTEQERAGQLVRAGLRPEYFPLYWVEPYQANRDIAGFDLGSDSRLHKAIREARDAGKPALASRFELMHRPAGHFAVALLRPVYSPGPPPDSVAQRRVRFRGAVLGVFCMSELVQEVLRRLPPESVQMGCFDLSVPKGEQLFYRYPRQAGGNRAARLRRSTRPARRTWPSDRYGRVGRPFAPGFRAGAHLCRPAPNVATLARPGDGSTFNYRGQHDHLRDHQPRRAK